MQLTVYGPLRAATGSKTVDLDVDPENETVRDAVEAFIQAYPRAEAELTDKSGALRPSVRIMVDDEKAALDDPLSNDASMTLFPAMRGGCVVRRRPWNCSQVDGIALSVARAASVQRPSRDSV